MIVASCLLSALLAVQASDPTPPPTDDQAVTLRLSDGTVLIGHILSEANGKLRVRTALIGEIDVESDSVVERTMGLPSHDGANGAITPPTEAPSAPSAPTARTTWARSFGIGGSFVSAPYEQGEIDEDRPGLTGKALGLPGEQTSAQITLSLVRSGPRDRWSLNSSVTYVNAQPTGRLTEAVKVDMNYSRTVSGRDFVFSSTGFRRDAVRNVDNSVIQIFGVGRRLIDTPTKKLELMPGVSVQRDEKGTIYDYDILVGYGFMETFSHISTHGVAFDQRFIFKTLVEDADLFTIDSYVGVRAPLTKRLALQVGLQFDHDEMLGLQRTVLPGTDIVLFANKKSTLQLTTGLQMSF